MRSPSPAAVAIATAALMLAGCASAVDLPRQGAPVDVATPQAGDQCAAQPTLDWCVARAGR